MVDEENKVKSCSSQKDLHIFLFIASKLIEKQVMKSNLFIILRPCTVFLIRLFLLNFCCSDNEQNWPNLHFDFALSP